MVAHIMHSPTRIFAIIAIALAMLLSAVPAMALPPGGTFVDDDGSPHEGDIEAIFAAGITSGCNPPVSDR